MTLQESNWNMDTGASSHLAENTGMLTSFSNPSLYKYVFVGNGQPIPVTHTGHSLLHTPHKPLHLHHVLVTPNIIKNLISVRQFTRDNNVSVDFDAYGFSVKDYQTRRLLLRCDSTGDLYPVTQQPSSTTTFALLSLSPTTWHRRLGHPSEDMLRRLESSHFISYNKTKLPALCHACQLGKHTKLPFYSSESNVGSVFDIIHSDLWTSPISSESGIKYYAIFLDHFSHYVWVYPLLHKSDLFDTFVTFRAYVNKQFNVDIKALQCDHGATHQQMPISPLSLSLTHEPTTLSSTPNTHITSLAATAHGNAPTTNTHHMVTHAKARISKLLASMNCHATTTSPIPRSHLHALCDPNWHKAMVDEYNALISNGTWAFVPRPANVNIVRSMWLFKHKFNADGSLSIVLCMDLNKLLGHGFSGLLALLHRLESGLFLSQSKFAEEILERAHMQHCNPCKTPVDTKSKLASDGDPRILRYVRGTIDHGLQLHVSSTSQLTAYTDADWAGCPVTRRSTSEYCVFLGDNLLSWSAKRQVTLSRSSAEAEYRGVANVVAETAWIQNLLLELHTPLSTATLVYYDNVSAVYLSTNPVQHQRTKHIEIDIHFIREYVASGQVRVLHVPSRF
ncbi:ribonuclease H-like domain-containing protein [Tanacetum coccineum]